jgi:hypothetical protein
MGELDAIYFGCHASGLVIFYSLTVLGEVAG